MKYLMELQNDFIIKGRFIAKTKEDGKTDYVNGTAGIAHGKISVDSVTALIPEYDQNGYTTGKLNQVFISKDDLKKVLSKVEELDQSETTGYPSDDLPF